eukprot:CAMPEP_0170463288 /NCGR_PEP_ID=MMETSP0123-20130129/8460_1 /TAXON_ID=182087 /ORGANISM="Favella ehrenbergii, Strain Fehren 1" /LENGTH=357 /DNA_ID=CAMNT_0010728691 /DNA_START=35 /DNA_END=1108 /DNA_ORIENTATION=-
MTIGLAPTLRRWGQNLFRSGMVNQAASAHEDTIQPSLRCVAISASKFPRLLDGDWIAPNATVIGDVRLGEGASLWHGVIVRGDTLEVSIGKNSTVQDLTRIGSNSQEGGKVTIGENVAVGPNVQLDACTLEDNCFIGMGATVQRGATVSSFSVLSAGAVLAEGETVPAGQIFAGAPARYLRDLTQEEKHLIAEHKMEMQQLSQVYSEETEKSFREVLSSEDNYLKYRRQDLQDKLVDKLGEIGMPVTHEDFEYIEHRIYHDYVASADFDMEDPNHQPGERYKTWTPYEHDLSHYPEVFHKYQENYAKYEKLKEETAQENPLEEQGDEIFQREIPRDMSPWEKKYDDLMPRYTGTSCQ